MKIMKYVTWVFMLACQITMLVMFSVSQDTDLASSICLLGFSAVLCGMSYNMTKDGEK